jgi:CHAT domain-containing protein/Tfp pilus assembly protein PilF
MTGCKPVTAALVLSAALGLRQGLLLGFSSPTTSGIDGQDDAATILEPGRSVERNLADGETQVFRVALLSDQYIELRVDQQGIELTVRVLDPAASERLQTTNPTGPHESRVLSFISAASGTYEVRVAPAAKHVTPGRYAVSLTSRSPTSDERRLEDARLLSARAATLNRDGKYDEAMPLARQSLDIRESVLGPDGLLVADSLHTIANIYDNKGNLKEAEPINLRALAIREAALGPDHEDVARSLYNLAWIYQNRQDFAKAEATYARALTIQQQVFGESHREIAKTLNDLGILYHSKGEYEKAIDVDLKVLAIRERILGASDADVGLSLNDLGLDYVKIGDYARAEPCFVRALQVLEGAHGPDHPDVALASNNLAIVYENKGDYGEAERLHLRALAIEEATRGPEHVNVGVDLNNLGRLYEDQKEYAKALPLFERALAIREKAMGPTHSELGEALNNLANIYVLSGTDHDDKVESMLERSRAILEQALGSDHVKVAAPLATLARFYDTRGQLDRAVPLYLQAIAIREKAIGPDDPIATTLAGRLAALYQAKGDTARALEYWTRYSDARERNIEHNLPIGSDRQKLSYLAVFADDIDNILSFHAQSAPDNPAARQLALTTILRRKGRGLDAAADTIGTLRARTDAGDRALFTSLVESRARLASLTLRGPERNDAGTYRTRVQQLSASVERIEADISTRSAAFRSESRPVTLEAVRSAIPADTALVEFARYQPKADRNAATPAPRYSAYILFANGIMAWVDVGDAPTLEQSIDEWRRALRDPHRADVRDLARTVDERVMRPVRAHLGASRRLLISPDGLLHLIPFAALVDEHGAYLVERYDITYLTSGRDLLRLQVPRPTRGTPVVVADPAFGGPALVTRNPTSPASPAVDSSQIFFGPLPGVRAEVSALRTLLPSAVFLTQESATKSALMQVAGPQLLHVATHGFFLQDAPSGANTSAGSSDADRTRLGKIAGAHVDNPLLRSGLALSGANAGGSRTADGILTALEAAGLDLWGTRLVVLSACDTGVGDVKSGDGVYGLKRALVLAGSESQLVSLWPVSDTGTRDLVIAYYGELLRGSERGDALRQVQQRILRSPERAHPYYWASFLLSGQWTKLETP